MKVLKVNFGAKCNDMADFRVMFEDGTTFEKDGYPPKVSGVCGGDYYDFTVENETGRILGWVPIKSEEVEELARNM